MTKRWILLATLFALFGVGIVVFTFSQFIPQLSLRAQVREGRAVMRLLLTALENSKAAERQIDALIAERILSSARLIAQLPHLDRTTLVTAAHLNNWEEAELLTPEGKVLISSRGLVKTPIPVDSVQSLWTSGHAEGVMLLGVDTLAVLVRRTDHSFLAVLYNLSSIRAFKTRLGIAPTIRKLGEAKGVRYVAYQTFEGILYAYPEEVTLTAIQSDSFLLDHLQRNAQGYRVLRTLGTHILEFVAPYSEEEGEFGLLRLGWDLRDYRSTVTRIRFMSLLLILVSLLIVFLLYRLVESQRRLQRQREDLELREAIRRRTLDTLPLGILEIGKDGRVLWMNHRARSLLGDQPERFLNPEEDLFHVHAVLQHGGTHQGEILWNHRWISYVTVALVDRVMVVLDDRTEFHALQKRLQKAQEQEVITHLVAGIVHEIRSPLNALSLRIQSLLIEDHPLGEHRQTLKEALGQIHRLEEAVRRVLALARPVEPAKEKVKVKEWLEAILSNYTLRSKQQGKTLVRDCQIPEEHILQIDPKGMREVLENLLENALEATKPGDTITVRIRVNDLSTAIEVEDTGSGIPPDLQERIFEPHVSTKPGGLGLGLYLVKRMIEAHGGRVKVETRPGQGTRFTLYIPHESADR